MICQLLSEWQKEFWRIRVLIGISNVNLIQIVRKQTQAQKDYRSNNFEFSLSGFNVVTNIYGHSIPSVRLKNAMAKHVVAIILAPPQFEQISVLHIGKYNFDYSLKIILALLPAKF